jgi:O-antigen/teichoic acid export membrane protein
MIYVGYAANPLMLPTASKLHDGGDDEGVAKLFADSQRVLVALFVAAVAGIVLFTPEIVKLTAGDAYLGTQTVMIVLAIAVGLDAVFGIYQWIFHLVRKPHYILWFSLVYMTLNLVAVFAAGVAGDTTLVAFAALAVVLVANTARFVIARRFIPIRMTTGAAVGLAAFFVALIPMVLVVRDMSLAARIPVGLALFGAVVASLWIGLTGRAVPGVARVALARSRVASPS